MASISMQWPPSYGFEVSVPLVPPTAEEPPRKRVKVDQACDQCRRRKRKCSTARPCFQCIEHNVVCDYNPQAVVDHPDPRFLDNELLKKQLQLCTESLKIHEERLHTLSARLEQLERGASGTPSSTGVAHVPPQSYSNNANYLDSSRELHYWPVADEPLSRASSRSKNGYVRSFEHLESSPAGIITTPTNFGCETLPIRGVGYTGPILGYGNPVELESDPQTVQLSGRLLNALLRSYVRNLHVLHPIVDLKFLESIWDRTFIKAANRQDNDPLQGDVSMYPHGRKRKRKGSQTFELDNSQSFDGQDEPQVQLETALAHIVLALGAVCSEKEALRRPAEVVSLEANVLNRTASNESLATNCSVLGAELTDSPWHAQKPRNVLNHAAGTASDVSKPQCPTYSKQGNFLRDIGRQYFTSAEKILSYDKDNAGLIHAQLFILAGLFEGQTGNHEEGMKWIRAAGQIAMKLLVSHNLLHPFESEACEDLHENYRRVQRLVKMPEHDFIVLIAWSCIQLEGEILTRLSLPPSGIEALESRIPWPYRIPNSDAYLKFSTKSDKKGGMVTGHYILVFYTSQLWIRKWLKTAQAELSGRGSTDHTDIQLCDILREQQSTLDCWRACLPEEIRWDDSDAPACDILSAKLRAAYWAAQYAISQIYLDYVLRDTPGGIRDKHPLDRQACSGIGHEYDSESQLVKAVGLMTTFEIMQGTKRCIKAAIEHIIAFDCIPHKLIATNIDGIAHAQFSSVLVLVAVSAKKPDLGEGVSFNALLERTIAFLDQHTSESLNCRTNSATLRKVLAGLDFEHRY